MMVCNTCVKIERLVPRLERGRDRMLKFARTHPSHAHSGEVPACRFHESGAIEI